MSNAYFEEQLREGIVALREELRNEESFPPPPKERNLAVAHMLNHYSTMYVRYLLICRKMEFVYDQMKQPQKRADTRICLDSCFGRVAEIRFFLVNLCGEYINFDDVLVDLKLTPDVLEIPIPRYFLEERKRELEERNKLLEALMKQYGQQPIHHDFSIEEPSQQLTPDHAVLILQSNERGRQGRQRAKFMKEIREQEERERKVLEFGTVESDPQEAATKVQKIFKGYLARKRTTAMKQEELQFLGMADSGSAQRALNQKRLNEVLEKRKLQQLDNQRESEQDKLQTRQRIKEQEGGKIMEDMHDAILEKLIKLRQASENGDIPEFPTQEQGGSHTFLTDKPELTEEEKLVEEEKRKKEEADKAKAADAAKKGKGKSASKSSSKSGKGGKGKGKKGEEDLPKEEEMKDSKFWKPLTDGLQRYVDVWQTRFDPLNFDQKHDRQLLRDQIMEGPGGLHSELRSYVDALVRVEISNLKAALERDRGGKKRGKKGKGKKGGKKKKKGKKDKDLTANKKMESLVNELVWTGFLQMPPKVKMSDYIGAHNLMATVMEEAEKVTQEQIEDVQRKWKQVLDNWNDNIEQSFGLPQDQFKQMFDKWVDQKKNARFVVFEPSMAQVRQAVTEYGVIPLGSKVVHDLAPHHNAMLLYGPAGSGKTLLSYAVTHESGSNFFNLSPYNLQDKFNNAKAVQMLLHMIFKVAKAMAPSVIYIDEVDKVFASTKGKKRKKGSADGGKAARIKKDLLIQMKDLQLSDRVLIIGNSRTPWEADFKELLKVFTCAMLTVTPDYASRLELWQKLVEKKGAKLQSHDAETLAYMSHKFAGGTISKIVNTVLTERRVKRLGALPLKAEEFLGYLAKVTPVFKEEFDQIKAFTLSLPLNMRKRLPTDYE